LYLKCAADFRGEPPSWVINARMKVEAHHLIHLLKWPPKVTQAFNQTHTCGTEMGDLGCIAVIPPQAFYLSTGVREVHSAGNIKSKRFAKKKKK
jgi:hypothetical protein